jgi:ferric-dicitrate binding protein FerR (iron transport regulator)
MMPPARGANNEETNGEFERHARTFLEESVSRIDSRVRSRLNQARHAALEEASRRPSLWRRFSLMPAASAVAAAALVAFVLWPHAHQGDSIVGENGHVAEDLELLADSDALDLVSDESDGGAFYEWAVDQSDSGEPGTTGA